MSDHDLMLGKTTIQRVREYLGTINRHVVARLYHRNSDTTKLFVSDIAAIVTERDTLKEINAELLEALKDALEDLQLYYADNKTPTDDWMVQAIGRFYHVIVKAESKS